MEQTYIEIMLQSLKKKLQVLDEIMAQNVRQREILEAPDGSFDEFDEVVEMKSALIDQLEQLDSGFEKLYERVKEELQGNSDAHADEIRQMKEDIRGITDRSVEIQAQEARNKDLMTQKFSKVKNQARQLRTNSKATTTYYQSMSKANLIDPQFMDNKK